MTKPRVVHRDSDNGQFITKREAERRPRETEREVIKPKPPEKPKKK